MFQFSLSYREPGYHKDTDPPFVFPPKKEQRVINSNLIEIRGKNGTGKTTLLNVLALALDYQNRAAIEDKNNQIKVTRTLNNLKNNNTLEYEFLITSSVIDDVKLELKKNKQSNPRLKLNGRPISYDSLKTFDVIYLTEDDPEKVISQSKKKLIKYFMDIDGYLDDVISKLYREKMENDSYLDINKVIISIESEISINKKKYEEYKDLEEKEEIIKKKVTRKNEINQILEIFGNEDEIIENYKKYYKLEQEYKNIDKKDINKKIDDGEKKLRKILHKINIVLDPDLIEMCNLLTLYEIDIEKESILNCEFEKLEKIRKNIDMQDELEKTIKFDLVEDMIKVFSKYAPNEEIPVFGSSISDALEELNKIKNRLNFDRIYVLLEELEKTMSNKVTEEKKKKELEDSIAELYELLEKQEKINYGEIRNKFRQYESLYIKLQSYSSIEKNSLLEEWNKLSKYEDDLDEVNKRLYGIKAELKLLKQKEQELKRKIKINREKIGIKPTYYDNKDNLNNLGDRLNRIREKMKNYLQILADPEGAKDYYEKRDNSLFTKEEYVTFYDAIGKYLGGLFEPVSYAKKVHKVDFFDIENNEFVTPEGRRIKIENLSQGQNKITALTPSLKRLGQNKKGIVLIDEIANLDVDNRNKVKNDLKKSYEEGKILLAIIVRPLSEEVEDEVEISSW